MRSLVKFGVGAALVVLVAISGILFHVYRQASTTLTAVRAEDEETRGHYSAALASIATIQDSLNAIVLGDEAVKLTPLSDQMERSYNRSEGDEILNRISVLRAGIERSKVRIQDLDEHLRRSGVRIEGLEKMMASLKRTVAQKEEMIAELTQRVDTLQTQVTGLTASVEEKRQELGTVYCMIGDKKDLTASGAVIATGGIFGIGKTLKPTGHLDESQCTTIDTDQMTTVDIPSPKAEVLSAQPPTSYQLEPNGDHIVLRILDPKEFRKVRQLVIMKRTA